MVSGSASFNTYNLAQIYNRNSSLLNESLARLASGKKAVKPSDDIGTYFRGQELQSRVNQYSSMKTNIGEWSGAMDVAVAASDELYNKVIRMQDLITMAGQETDATVIAGYTSEYKALAAAMESIINSTTYQGKALLRSATAIATVSLSPESAAATLSINPGIAIADATITALKADVLTAPADRTLATTNLVTTAKAALKTYMTTVSGYASTLQSHSNIADSAISNYQSSINSILNIDDAAEMVTYTARDIRTQASLAMMAQSNNSSRSILALFGLRA